MGPSTAQAVWMVTAYSHQRSGTKMQKSLNDSDDEKYD